MGGGWFELYSSVRCVIDVHMSHTIWDGPPFDKHILQGLKMPEEREDFITGLSRFFPWHRANDRQAI